MTDEQHPETSTSTGESYVLCEVAGTAYAIASDDIEQLEMPGALTPFPNAPAFVDGVTSVRGRVIPVVSMRARFGFPRATADLRSRIVVVRSAARSVGLMVDSAREFATIAEASVQAPPAALVDAGTRYLRGIAHLGERLVLVLDVDELLATTDTLELPPALSNQSAGTLPASM